MSNYSLKMASSSRNDKQTLTANCFSFDVENVAVGTSKTATVEIISYSLNNDDIQLLLEYMGTSSSSLASFVNSLPTSLTAVAALPTSTATWSAALPTLQGWSATDLVAITLSNSNLTATSTGNSGVRHYTGLSAGKYYWEATVGTITQTNTSVGVSTASAVLTSINAGNGSAVVQKNGGIWIGGGSNPAAISALVNGSIIGIALDVDGNLIWFRNAPSGNWNNSGTANPATGVGGFAISAIIGPSPWFPSFGTNVTAGEAVTINPGPGSFSGVAPSGFSALPIGVSTKQKLQVTFTPQRAGRVRGLVRLGKPATTVWVNPQIAIT